VPTGVKYLHHAAERYDIGVYFEANGHGTVIFSPEALQQISTTSPSTPGQKEALDDLHSLTELINQTVGDALSDLLFVETILINRRWGPKEWDAAYTDLPNRLVKVLVQDRNVFTTADAERTLITPEGLQAKIDSTVQKYPKGRSFVRPSGTEDCVRVYAEASGRAEADGELRLDALFSSWRLTSLMFPLKQNSRSRSQSSSSTWQDWVPGLPNSSKIFFPKSPNR